jgi:hypothetical protein
MGILSNFVTGGLTAGRSLWAKRANRAIIIAATERMMLMSVEVIEVYVFRQK